MSRELKQTLAIAFIVGILGIAIVLMVVGHYARKTHEQQDALHKLTTDITAKIPEYMRDPEAPFVDLKPCFLGPNFIHETTHIHATGVIVGYAGSHNVLIGKKTDINGMGDCVIAIGDGVKVPPNMSYFFNIGNRYCGSMITGQRLSCKTGRPFKKHQDRPPLDVE